jgi:hypothetical protein
MKRKFKEGDCVSFTRAYRKEIEIGKLVEYAQATKLWSIDKDNEDEFIFLAEKNLTLVPPVVLSPATLKALIRFEITYPDFSKLVIPNYNWTCSETYHYTLDDMIAMINNLKNKTASYQELSDWSHLVYEDLDDHYQCEGDVKELEDTPLRGFNSPQNDAAMANEVFRVLFDYCMFNPEAEVFDKVDLDLILEDIENYKNGRAIHNYLWTSSDENEVLNRLDNPNYVEALEPEALDRVRKMILNQAERGENLALEVLGYGYYGGSLLFECNWEKSRDIFLKMMGKSTVLDEDKCRYANTLGYIYYYGRCNNSVPEYDKAFKYFSLGAAGGLFESLYKLSDMYKNGYFVEKNTKAAETLVRLVYDHALRRFEAENFGGKLADVALRMGNLCRDGITKDEDEYYYYTLADYAIKKRLEFHQYGDEKVATDIQKELDRIRQARPLKHRVTISGDVVEHTFGSMFKDCPCKVKVTTVKEGLRIIAERVQPDSFEIGDEKPECIVECYPEYGYCELTKRMVITAHEVKKMSDTAQFYADCFHVLGKSSDDEYLCLFTHHREPVYMFAAKRLTRKIKRDKL